MSYSPPGPIRSADQAIDLDPESRSLVTLSTPEAETDLAAVLRPAVAGMDLAAWLCADDTFLVSALARYGAVLLRGFDCTRPDQLGALVTAWGGTAAEYRYGSTPRTRLAAGVYTSTDYPADQSIPLHNEQSYAASWPRRLWFACAQPAAARGATPLADSRRVLARISPATRELFRGGVRYVRNYGEFDLSWPQVFGTHDRGEVERFCRKTGIEWQWLGQDRLRTEQVLPAEQVHPVTGEPVWFNQAHLFHVSSLPAEVSAALLGIFTEQELPRHAFLGDGRAIPPVALAEVRAAYAAESTRFDWETGDVLVIDNLLVAHGREPYRAPRSILVAMTE